MTRSVRPLLVLGALWFVAAGLRAGAQKEEEKTTLVAVYSTAQAERGGELYGNRCLGGCHQAASHKGPTFKTHWAGRPLSELYTQIYESMPDDDPGSLSPKQGAEIVAYLLKMNNLPAGKDDLPADAALLKKIRIEVPD